MLFLVLMAIFISIMVYLFKFAKFSMIAVEDKLGVNNSKAVAFCVVASVALQMVGTILPVLWLPAMAASIGCLLIVWKYIFYWLEKKVRGRNDDMVEYFKWKHSQSNKENK